MAQSKRPPAEQLIDYAALTAAIHDAMAIQTEREAEDRANSEARQLMRADLQAQQWMAKAAIVLAFFTLGQVILTGIGLVLLVGTLNATKATLREAEMTTAAAVESNRTAREIGEAQVRAYLNVPDAWAVIDSSTLVPLVGFNMRNTGASPAKNVQMKYRCSYSLGLASIRSQGDFPEQGIWFETVGKDLGPNDPLVYQNTFSDFPVLPEEKALITDSTPLIFDIMARVRFIDVFGKQIIEEQDWTAIVTPGHFDKKIGLRRVHVSHFSMNLPRRRMSLADKGYSPDTGPM